MAIADVTVRLTEIDREAGTFLFEVGQTGVSVSIDQFRDMMRGHDRDARHLIRNVAVRLMLAGVDITKPSEIRAALSSTTFKF